MTKCPVCGYNEVMPSKLQTSAMNEYVNKADSKDRCILNSAEKEVTVGKVTYVLAGSLSSEPTKPQPQGTAPVKPTAPTTPAK